jgi:hypothetical protein
MYKAGYDPGAAVSFFEKLQARESAKKKLSSLFASHPATEDRVAATKENIEKYLPGREQYLVTTSEFQRVKTLLAQIQDRQTPSDRDRAPSLRRPAPSRRNPDDADEEESDRTTRPEDREPDADAPPVLRRPQDRPQYAWIHKGRPSSRPFFLPKKRADFPCAARKARFQGARYV